MPYRVARRFHDREGRESAGQPVFATAIFTGEPMWFTVPVGIAALVVIETVRWDHRLRHEAVKTPELVAFELLAIAIVGWEPLRSRS